MATFKLALYLVLCPWALVVAADLPEYKPAVDTPVGRRVFADLAAYYSARAAENGDAGDADNIPYREMAERLASQEPAQRNEAGEYLLALCLQTDVDDRSGRSPRPRGFKLGGGPNNYGAELRGRMASAISAAPFHGDGKDAWEVARWLYKHDTWPSHREDAVSALTRIRTPQSDQLFVEMVKNAEGHFGILTVALKQAAARKLGQARDHMSPLCRHYHPEVRQAALAAAAELGLKDIVQYDARTDLGPRLEPWLRSLLAVLPERIPADAKWHRFTIPSPVEFNQEIEICGWLLGEDAENYQVLDWTGRRDTWSRQETNVRLDTLREFAERIAKIREQFNASEDNELKSNLQEKLGIRSFMMSSRSTWHGSIPEVLAAAWSLERGDRETCAKLMVPLLADVSDEQGFLNHLRDQIATTIDARMLLAFTDRDYGEALRLAKLLATPYFDGFEHQDRATGLVATLPRRSEDFKSLTLVTPEKWRSLKSEYNRQVQIEFLAERLRLIHARQWGIPGGISYGNDQFLPEDDAPRDTPAFNPYCELLRLNLTGSDLVHLLPYLDSPDYILAYDLYRFIPNDPFQLHKVSWVAASIFNDVAQQELVDIVALEGASDEERQRNIEQIRQWCTEHAAVSHADHLARTIAKGEEWDDVKVAFWSLHELDEDRAIKLIVARCEGDAACRPELARLVCLLDRKELLPRARQWMQDRDAETKFWGALLVLKHSDPKQPAGLDIVLERLAAQIDAANQEDAAVPFGSDPDSLVDGAVETLLAVHDPRVRQFFVTYCGSKPYGKFDPSSGTLQRLFLAGYESAHERLLFQLDDNRPAYPGSDQPRSDNWLLWVNYWRYEDPPNLPVEKRAEGIVDLKHWLGAQFQLVKDGKPTSLIKDRLDVPWGDWKMYSSGWVRRL